MFRRHCSTGSSVLTASLMWRRLCSSSAGPEVLHMGKKKLKRLARQQQQQEIKAAAAASAKAAASAFTSETIPQQDFPRPLAKKDCPPVAPTEASQQQDATPQRVIPSTSYLSFNSVTPLSTFRTEFAYLQDGERAALPPPVSGEAPASALTSCDRGGRFTRVGGRVVSIRDLGKVLFITLRSSNETIQVCINVGEHFTKEQLTEVKQSMTTGDIIGAEGTAGRTKKGELTLFAVSVKVLTPYVCSDLTVIPDQRGHGQVFDPELKYRYRFIDMITDPSTIQIFKMRHAVIDRLRRFLNERQFIEVETPMFHSVPCGANAKPFSTHHNANNSELFLRIAPELYLKQCVVGGLDRVYEIGKVFRNEDADKSHNPEFTSCEFYAAYHTYEDLMPMTEELLRDLAIAASGAPLLEVTSCVSQEPVVIDLRKPFRRVNCFDEIQKLSGVELPHPRDLDSPRGIAFMAGIMLKHNIAPPTVRTAAKMFDKLIDFFITDGAVEPTFVCDHPLFMSPLAKESEVRPGLSERFELFVNGMEICNSYSELNDPQEQLRRFEQQLRDKEMGDDEAMSLDETFLKSLQTGLPPTAGWGMGIDRVVMLLTKSTSIRDVIVFPLLRQDEGSHDAKRRKKTASFFGFNQHMTLFCLSALEAELQRRGEHGQKTEHLKSLRRTVLELSRKQNEFQEQLLKCGSEKAGGPPCSLFMRMMHFLLFGSSKR